MKIFRSFIKRWRSEIAVGMLTPRPVVVWSSMLRWGPAAPDIAPIVALNEASWRSWTGRRWRWYRQYADGSVKRIRHPLTLLALTLRWYPRPQLPEARTL